jgi:hypothetical protein
MSSCVLSVRGRARRSRSPDLTYLQNLSRNREPDAGGTCVLSVRGRARRSRSPDGRSARAMAEMRGRCVTPSSSAAALAAAASSVWEQEARIHAHVKAQAVRCRPRLPSLQPRLGGSVACT